jgi:hypothetical protein
MHEVQIIPTASIAVGHEPTPQVGPAVIRPVAEAIDRHGFAAHKLKTPGSRKKS